MGLSIIFSLVETCQGASQQGKTVAHSDGVVFQSLIVNGHAHWRAMSRLLRQIVQE